MGEYCPNYSKALYARDDDQKRLIYSRASCGMWTCAHCAKVKRQQWLKMLIEGIKKIASPEWGFWTLTHDLQDAPYVEQRKLLSSAWNRLIGQIKYHADHEIFYIRVIEIGARGTKRMHLHVMINFVPSDLREIKQKFGGRSYFWSDEWGARVEKAGFGRIQDIRDVSGTLAYKSPEIALGSDLETSRAVLVASYVTKYMTKLDEATNALYPKRTRRFNASRNFPKLEDSEEFVKYEWRVGDRITETDANNAWRHGLKIFDLQRKTEINIDDFDEGGSLIENVD